MILYNISTKIDLHLADEWLDWQIREHIPEVMTAGFFDSYQLFRLLDQDDSDGLTFVIQFRVGDPLLYKAFSPEYQQRFRQQVADKWGDHCVSFQTSMELVR